MSEFTQATSIETGAETTYTLFAAFRVSSSHPLVVDGREVAGLVQELEDVTEMLGNEGVTVRGWYDTSGMKHDADLLVWLHGEAPEDLQWGLRELRRTAVLRPLIRVSGAVGVHAAGTPVAHTVGSAGVSLDDPAQQWVAVAQRAPLDLVIHEADDVAELAPELASLDDANIGRFIEIVEMIEVLQ